MRVDVTDLRKFYASRLGQAARRMLVRRLTALWPDARGHDVLALGYATPFVFPYAHEARSMVAAMPALQGVERWPLDGRAASVLCEDACIPFRESQFDRVIAAHILEETETLRGVLAELQRVTAPSGRLMLIVANRRGLWSRVESTPFGHGRSFTRDQLNKALRVAQLEPVAWARAVFTPPWGFAPFIRASRSFERIGERVAPELGGVLMIEAVKRVVKPVGGAKVIRPVFRPQLAGAPTPQSARNVQRAAVR